MLVVVARVQAKQGQENAVAAMLAPAAKASREDAGCLFYRAYADVEDPTLFTTYEEWDSRADLEAHLGGAGVAQLIGALGDLVASAPSIVAHEVSATELLM